MYKRQYLLMLGYFLFFAEEYGRRNWSEADYRYNLELFREIGRFWTYREQLGFWPAFLNIGGNIIGFLPFGLLLPVMHRNLRKSLPVDVYKRQGVSSMYANDGGVIVAI